MKPVCLIVVATLAGPVAAPAADTRTFTSADGSRSFDGTLVAYSEEAGKLKVRLEDGREATLAAEALSETDRKWLRETGTWVLRADALEVELKPNKLPEEVIEDQAGGRAHRTLRFCQSGYAIVLRNPTAEALTDLTLEFVFYARKRVTDASEVVRSEGSFSVGSVEPGKQVDQTTDYLMLEKTDRLLGMVLRIKRDGRLLRTVETEPGVGEQLERQIREQQD